MKNTEQFSCAECTGKYCARKAPIFSVLDNLQLSDVMSMIQRRRYKKGQVIFFEGDVSDKFYIINMGKIKIYKYNKEGKEQILYILSEGDFIGYLSLLKKGKVDFNAEALEDVSVCILTKDDFDKIVKKTPEISLRILENLHDRLVSLENLVQTLSTKDIETRIAALLRNFVKDFGREEEEGTVIDLPLSREEMANYIGVTRETMSRKLTAMEEEGVIELVGNKKVVIKDAEALEEMS
ncbi:Crp/Fnr family transcriptional regulator [Clostridium swellfunianum]|uniref:Crp/Fnr family transcriptional regulator n=1 Tax=Clostridium swellfunianum TaxID=1367462 RepID=UPI00202F4FB4|nr:Crp/Fnr family transcriptional regulator [Clostridium swellfunianum]MCM0648238.1 Crp/Fnr family transcriptional regulator [Clostridium swellfunianum]